MLPVIHNFNHTIDFWINELDRYDFTTLCTKPSPSSWSLGEVYVHLISEVEFHLAQITECLSTDEYANEEAYPNGKKMLAANEFPDEIIEGPPSNAEVTQPSSKAQLHADLIRIREEMNKAAAMILQNIHNGKVPHPGLGYFSASEWMQFSDMHFRHHLRQKKRIDSFLTTGSGHSGSR